MKFMLGLFTGMGIIIFIAYLDPRNIIPVNNELIKANMAKHDEYTGRTIWLDKYNRDNK